MLTIIKEAIGVNMTALGEWSYSSGEMATRPLVVASHEDPGT